MKNLFETIFDNKVFLPFVLVMLGISVIDLIGLGAEGNFGAGWVVTFLYFFSWAIYNISKKR